MRGQSLLVERIIGCYIKCDEFYERDMYKEGRVIIGKSWGEFEGGGDVWFEQRFLIGSFFMRKGILLGYQCIFRVQSRGI